MHIILCGLAYSSSLWIDSNLPLSSLIILQFTILLQRFNYKISVVSVRELANVMFKKIAGVQFECNFVLPICDTYGFTNSHIYTYHILGKKVIFRNSLSMGYKRGCLIMLQKFSFHKHHFMWMPENYFIQLS